MSSSSSSTPLLRSSSLALLPPLLLFLLLPSLPSAAAPLGFRLPRSEDAYLNRHEHWIDQTLDHFSPTDHRKFSQRYYEFLDYFNAPDGPVFLKICGEYPCHGIINDYMSVLARKFGAAVVSLEHRYYGKSSPFRTFTTENLRYLSSKQALFDLAVFRQYYQDSLNTKFNHTNVGNSWFVFGISYAGALSAWFREKFPHLTCGSLASSGVVLAVYNFTVFDKQVGESAGVECKGVLQEITRIVEERLLTDGAKIKYLFGAASLENVDFLYLLADASAMAFQYGDPDNLCIPLIKAKEAGEDLVEEYARLVKDHYLGTLGISIQIYDRHHLKHVSLSEDENGNVMFLAHGYLVFSYPSKVVRLSHLISAIRLWWYQVCTEVAYFQVAPSNDSVRSMKIDSQYHLDLCRNVFGEELHPSVDMTNLYYGATKIAGTRIVFTNGSQDPWRHASKQESSPDLPSYIIRCHNCGHGSDMRGCPQSSLNIEGNSKDCTSPEAVDKVREQMVKDIDLWLSQCQETGPDGYPYLLPI